MRNWITRHRRGFSTFGWFFGVGILWEIIAFVLADIVHDPMAENKLPYLHDTIIRLIDDFGILSIQAGISFQRALYGYLYGVLAGVILAILMNLSRVVEKMIMPYLVMSQMIPILALAPIIFCLVKDMNTARTVIAAFITFFPVSVNMLNGLKSVDGQKMMMMKSYASNPFQVYVKLLLPHSLPHLFVGLRLAAPMAVAASILVDTLSAKDGIGFVLVYSLAGGGTVGQFWPAILMCSLMGILSYYIVALIERIVIPWQKNEEV